MTGMAQRELGSPDATARFGAEVALWLRQGDLVALTGPIGAGKTVLARAVIEALGGGGEVPSPTFTLVQSYPDLRIPTAHFDLYRIEDAAEIDELGLDDALDSAIALVEWADRIAGLLPPDRLEICLRDLGGDARLATVTGFGAWEPRLERCLALSAFIDRAGWPDARRDWLKGDASARAYERITRPGGGESAVVMNAPRGPDGPPVRGGRPYSRIAHLAEDVRAFVAVGRHLGAAGLSAPRILAADMENGFLLIEDLGDRLYGDIIATGADLTEPYGAAIGALGVLHAAAPPPRLDIDGGATHILPPYDLDAMLIEAELLIDWALPALTGAPCPDDLRGEYRALWSDAIGALSTVPVLTLRDFHSPNLLWLPDREGVARAGIIDFQDALIGHPAYDLVSLAQDARIDLPDGFDKWIVETYLENRPRYCAAIARDDFAADYAVLGAQRAAKIVGIFTRLAVRDKKDTYLAHIPRVVRYLRANLQHYRLAPLAGWIARHVDLDRDIAGVTAKH